MKRFIWSLVIFFGVFILLEIIHWLVLVFLMLAVFSLIQIVIWFYRRKSD